MFEEADGLESVSVFISYRRGASDALIGRFVDRLGEAFGAQNVFQDTARIKGGDPWKNKIDESLALADVVVVAIGDRWDDPPPHGNTDWVHYELEAAREKGCPVLPLLLDGASLPNRGNLGDIEWIADLEAMELRSKESDFRTDVRSIIDRMRELRVPGPVPRSPPADEGTSPPDPSGQRRSVVVAVILAVVVVVVVAMLLLAQCDTSPDRGSPTTPAADTLAAPATEADEATTTPGPSGEQVGLLPGEELKRGEWRDSAGGGEFRLDMQVDGNLTIYRHADPRDVLFATGTHTAPAGIKLRMQDDDGNLVIYDANDHGIWDTETYPNPGASMRFDSDGHMRIVAPDGEILWETRVEVPDLVGETEARARQALAELDLVPDVEYVEADHDVGRVVSVTEPVGQDAYRTGTVHVRVARASGPPPTSAPSSTTTAAATTTVSPTTTVIPTTTAPRPTAPPITRAPAGIPRIGS